MRSDGKGKVGEGVVAGRGSYLEERRVGESKGRDGRGKGIVGEGMTGEITTEERRERDSSRRDAR